MRNQRFLRRVPLIAQTDDDQSRGKHDENRGDSKNREVNRSDVENQESEGQQSPTNSPPRRSKRIAASHNVRTSGASPPSSEARPSTA